MKKDEIITLLAGQLEVANKRITELLNRINDLTACVRSLEQALLDKEESLEKQKNINRGLTRIASNTSEKQRQTVPVLSGEERLKRRRKRLPPEKHVRITGPDVKRIRNWRWRSMMSILMPPTSTSALPLKSRNTNAHVYVMNVYRCVSSNMSIQSTAMHRVTVSIKERHLNRLS